MPTAKPRSTHATKPSSRDAYRDKDHPDLCDVCSAVSFVDDSRPLKGARWRRRVCSNWPKCRRRWTTWEARQDPRVLLERIAALEKKLRSRGLDPNR